MNTRPRLSILVKALNEEAKIADCLKSACRDAALFDGEVILADSLSTDRTVDIARTFPVRIVQFARPEDRNCGAAVQMAYQFSRGDFVYVLDADMVLQEDFIAEGMRLLDRDPSLAGVGGRLVDTQFATTIDRHRSAQYDQIRAPKLVQELGGGGLYRSAAIREVGHLAHRGLRAFEEAELGLRLRAQGWKLARIPLPAVAHTGHNESDWQMLVRQWRNGRAAASGSLIRESIGTRWWWRALKKQRYVFNAPIAHMAFLGIGGAGAWAADAPWARSLMIAEIAGWIAMWLLLVLVRKSPHWASFSIAYWHFAFFATVRGLLTPAGNPGLPIDAREINGPGNATAT